MGLVNTAKDDFIHVAGIAVNVAAVALTVSNVQINTYAFHVLSFIFFLCVIGGSLLVGSYMYATPKSVSATGLALANHISLAAASLAVFMRYNLAFGEPEAEFVIFQALVATLVVVLIFILAIHRQQVRLTCLLILLVFCAPPFVVRHNYLVGIERYLLALFVINYLLERWRTRRDVLHFNSFLLLLTLLLGWLGVATLTSIGVDRSLYEFVQISYGIVLAVLIAEEMKGLGDVLLAAAIPSVLGLMMAGMSWLFMLERIRTLGWIEGTASRLLVLLVRPRDSALYLGVLLAVLALSFVRVAQPILRRLCEIGIFLTLVALLLSFDVISWFVAGLMVASVVASTGPRLSRAERVRIYAIGVVLVILIGAGAFLFPERIITDTVTATVRLVQGRYLTAQIIGRSMDDRWLNGYGPDTNYFTFPAAYAEVRPYQNFSPTYRENTGSLYWEFLHNTGITGLVLFLLVVLWILVQLFRHSRQPSIKLIQAGGRAVLAGLLVDGLVYYRLDEAPYALIWWLLIAVALWLKIQSMQELPGQRSVWFSVGLSGLAGLLLTAVCCLQVATTASQQLMIRAGDFLGFSYQQLIASRLSSKTGGAAVELLDEQQMMFESFERDRWAPQVRANLARARGYLEKARALNPWSQDPLFWMGWTMAVDDPPSGLACIGQAVQLSPYSYRTYLLLALFQEHQNSRALAEKSLRQGLRLEPNQPQATWHMFLAKNLLLGGKQQEAAGHLVQALLYHPQNVILLREKRAFYPGIEPSKLMDDVTNEIQNFPKTTAGYRLLVQRAAQAFYLLQEYERGIRWLERENTLSPSVANAVWIARMQAAAGYASAVEPRLKSALGPKQSDCIVWNELAYFRLDRGDFSGAIDAALLSIRSWASLDIDNHLAHAILYAAYLQSGDTIRAQIEKQKRTFLAATFAQQLSFEEFRDPAGSLFYEQCVFRQRLINDPDGWLEKRFAVKRPPEPVLSGPNDTAAQYTPGPAVPTPAPDQGARGEIESTQ